MTCSDCSREFHAVNKHGCCVACQTIRDLNKSILKNNRFKFKSWMFDIVDDSVFAGWLSANIETSNLGYSAKVHVQDRINRILNI